MNKTKHQLINEIELLESKIMAKQAVILLIMQQKLEKQIEYIKSTKSIPNESQRGQLIDIRQNQLLNTIQELRETREKADLETYFEFAEQAKKLPEDERDAFINKMDKLINGDEFQLRALDNQLHKILDQEHANQQLEKRLHEEKLEKEAERREQERKYNEQKQAEKREQERKYNEQKQAEKREQERKYNEQKQAERREQERKYNEQKQAERREQERKYNEQKQAERREQERKYNEKRKAEKLEEERKLIEKQKKIELGKKLPKSDLVKKLLNIKTSFEKSLDDHLEQEKKDLKELYKNQTEEDNMSKIWFIYKIWHSIFDGSKIMAYKYKMYKTKLDINQQMDQVNHQLEEEYIRLAEQHELTTSAAKYLIDKVIDVAIPGVYNYFFPANQKEDVSLKGDYAESDGYEV